MLRKTLALATSALLIWTQSGPALAQGAHSPELEQLTQRSYLELLDLAPQLRFSLGQFEAAHDRLKDQEKAEKKRLKKEEKRLEDRIDEQRDLLRGLNRRASRDDSASAEQRREVHCSLAKLEDELRRKRIERKQGLPVAFDNRQAKLDLIQLWPAKKREIDAAVDSGQARMRPHGDVEDIGIRLLREGQEKDIKKGQRAIRELKAYGMIPPEVKDEQVVGYVRGLAQLIGSKSDLKVPLQVTVLDSLEVNAFALPGGFVFVNRGLIEKAESESELAGVIAHEIAHVTARHGARLMKKATVAGVIFQAAQVASVVFTGGTVGVGTYYALQYGFFGLGMVLNLKLLGVSREYEEEADQLGAQYAWNAGFDPRGFITFFDKLASEKGYVQSASFFRTHPPFFERIVSTISEITYLPEKEDLRIDSLEFQKVKERLKHLAQERKKNAQESKGPTLRRLPPCDPLDAANLCR